MCEGGASVQGRYRVLGEGGKGLSLGGDLRLPTGRRDDLLGSGTTAGRMIAISSFDYRTCINHTRTPPAPKPCVGWPVEQGLNISYVVAGAKWNIARDWLLNSNILLRFSDGGLRARVTPTLSLGFDFQ